MGINNIGMNPVTRRYQCPGCEKNYSDRGNMRRHYKFECNQPRYFKCSYCGKLNKRKGDLFEHMRIYHLNLPYKWDIIQHL